MQLLTSIRKPIPVFWMLHLVLFFLFMYPLLFQPDAWMVHGYGDGLKNYFTLQSYLAQPAEEGYFRFSGMQYPYGESIWYTDNSPLIALILRIIQVNVADIAPYSVMLINWIMLLNLLLAPFVLIRLLRGFIQHEWLVVIGALVCIWTSPQFLRYFNGNLNLSISIFYFIAIDHLLHILYAIRHNDRRSLRRNSLMLCGLIILASCIHLYYLLLLGVPVVIVLCVHGILFLRQRQIRAVSYLAPMLSVVIAAICVIGLIRVTDPDLSKRTDPPDGKHIPAWEMRFFHLYKAREGVNPIPFLGGKMGFDPENGNYLGGFFWYGVSAIILLAIIRRIRATQLKLTVSRNTWVFVVGAVMVFFASAGMHIYASGRTVLMDNYFNPLYYMEKLYPPLEHFRCIARMGWWIFYMAQFGLLLLLDRVVRMQAPRIFIPVVAVLSLIAMTDIYGYYQFAGKEYVENSFSEKALERIPDIPYTQYQAILPVPYYNVGSEDYTLTIDDSDSWSRYTYQLQIKSGLPLMSVKLSRTPPEYARQYLDIFLKDAVDPQLLAGMRDKPVLVVYDSSKEAFSTLEPAKSAIAQAPDLMRRKGMQEIWRSGTITYYAWHIQ